MGEIQEKMKKIEIDGIINWHNYSKDKPKFPGYYLVSYYGFSISGVQHICFNESYWDGLKFISWDKDIEYWTNVNWPS